MKLFLLKPREDLPSENNPWIPPYGRVDSFLIIAENETEARKMAESESQIESTHNDVWLDPAYTMCKEIIISQFQKAEILMIDEFGG